MVEAAPAAAGGGGGAAEEKKEEAKPEEEEEEEDDVSLQPSFLLILKTLYSSNGCTALSGHGGCTAKCIRER